MSVKTEIGKQIKKLRIDNGYTQEKLSELIGISQRALSSIESGRNFISAETLENLLKIFNTSLEDFFSTNSFKEVDELLKMIYKNIEKIKKNPAKLEIIYNLTRSLIK